MGINELNLMEERTPAATPPESTASPGALKAILEALLFATDEPLSLSKMRQIVGEVQPVTPKALGALLEEMKQEYAVSQRGFVLEEIAGGYLLRTKKEHSKFVAQLATSRKAEKLSPAASEVLAIIAYKGPITKPQIEQIRGVDSSGSVASLAERGLISEVGKLEGPGRPTLYSVTPRFLQLFGLKDLDDLPHLDM